MPRHFLQRRPAFGLLFALVVSCAGAPRADSALPEPTEGPCELSVESLQEIDQLDREFEPKYEGPMEEGGADGYPYAFVDDPFGATVDDGACECLAEALPSSGAASCRRALRGASVCLGGPNSVRLWSHRNCLPYRMATATAYITIEYAQNGCTVPDSGFLHVTTEERRSRSR